MNSHQKYFDYQVRLSSRSWHLNIIKTYVFLLTIFFSFIVYLGLARYLQAFTGGVILAKYVYIGMAIAVVPVAVFRRHALRSYLSSPFVSWFLAWTLLNIFHLLINIIDGNNLAVDITSARIQNLILAVIIGFVFFQVRPQTLSKTFISIALLLTSMQVFDFLRPGTFLPLDTEGIILGRSGSTLINANAAVESLVLLSVLGMGILPDAARVWLLLGVLPGVFLTFSRSGLLALLIYMGLAFLLRLFSRSAYLVIFFVILLLVVNSQNLMNFFFQDLHEGVLENIFNRLEFFLTLDADNYSTAERKAVASFAFESFLLQPFFGNGSGYTFYWRISDQGPHNQHLLILAEYGIVGYALFVWLIVLMIRGGVYFRNMDSSKMHIVFLIIFLWFTIYTHNMFDNLYWMVSFVFLAQRKIYLHN